MKSFIFGKDTTKRYSLRLSNFYSRPNMQQTAATKSAGSFFFCVSYSYSFHAGGSVFKMVSQPGLDGLRWFKMVSQHVQAGLKMITQTWNLKSAQTM